MNTRRGLEIRAALSADAPGLAEFFSAVGQPIAARALAERLEALRQGPGTALIAVEWGPPSGLIVAHWYRTLADEHPTAQITTLLVAPDDRRRGIGRLLVKAAAQAARVAGCDTLEMSATSRDQSLQEFCRATGFLDAGPRFVRALRKKA